MKDKQKLNSHSFHWTTLPNNCIWSLNVWIWTTEIIIYTNKTDNINRLHRNRLFVQLNDENEQWLIVKIMCYSMWKGWTIMLKQTSSVAYVNHITENQNINQVSKRVQQRACFPRSPIDFFTDLKIEYTNTQLICWLSLLSVLNKICISTVVIFSEVLVRFLHSFIGLFYKQVIWF